MRNIDTPVDFVDPATDGLGFPLVRVSDGEKETWERRPKVYRALLSQGGTDAPAATVLENTLSGDVVWTRDGAGNYTATLADAFDPAKTFPTVSVQSSDVDVTLVMLSCGSGNTLSLTALNGESNVQDGFTLSVEVLVYP